MTDKADTYDDLFSQGGGGNKQEEVGPKKEGKKVNDNVNNNNNSDVNNDVNNDDDIVITKKKKAPKDRKLEGVYLDDIDREIIANIQEKTGRDKSEIVRKALRFLDENVTIK